MRRTREDTVRASEVEASTLLLPRHMTRVVFLYVWDTPTLGIPLPYLGIPLPYLGIDIPIHRDMPICKDIPIYRDTNVTLISQDAHMDIRITCGSGSHLHYASPPTPKIRATTRERR